MSTGLVPKNMKIAKVIPIFKSGNKHIFNNYRPISLLPVFSKILEKVMATKLLKYLNSFYIFYKHQYGFRPKAFYSASFYSPSESNCGNNDKTTKELTLAVFIDLSKAFDTISHDILLNKLENLGIRGIPNKCFACYSTNHVYLHRPNAFGFWQTRLHLCYETLKRVSNFSELA